MDVPSISFRAWPRARPVAEREKTFGAVSIIPFEGSGEYQYHPHNSTGKAQQHFPPHPPTKQQQSQHPHAPSGARTHRQMTKRTEEEEELFRGIRPPNSARFSTMTRARDAAAVEMKLGRWKLPPPLLLARVQERKRVEQQRAYEAIGGGSSPVWSSGGEEQQSHSTTNKNVPSVAKKKHKRTMLLGADLTPPSLEDVFLERLRRITDAQEGGAVKQRSDDGSSSNKKKTSVYGKRPPSDDGSKLASGISAIDSVSVDGMNMDDEDDLRRRLGLSTSESFTPGKVRGKRAPKISSNPADRDYNSAAARSARAEERLKRRIQHERTVDELRSEFALKSDAAHEVSAITDRILLARMEQSQANTPGRLRKRSNASRAALRAAERNREEGDENDDGDYEEEENNYYDEDNNDDDDRDGYYHGNNTGRRGVGGDEDDYDDSNYNNKGKYKQQNYSPDNDDGIGDYLPSQSEFGGMNFQEIAKDRARRRKENEAEENDKEQHHARKYLSGAIEADSAAKTAAASGETAEEKDYVKTLMAIREQRRRSFEKEHDEEELWKRRPMAAVGLGRGDHEFQKAFTEIPEALVTAGNAAGKNSKPTSSSPTGADKKSKDGEKQKKKKKKSKKGSSKRSENVGEEGISDAKAYSPPLLHNSAARGGVNGADTSRSHHNHHQSDAHISPSSKSSHHQVGAAVSTSRHSHHSLTGLSDTTISPSPANGNDELNEKAKKEFKKSMKSARKCIEELKKEKREREDEKRRRQQSMPISSLQSDHTLEKWMTQRKMKTKPRVNEKILRELQIMFQFLDEDHGGTVSATEIQKAFEILGHNPNRREIEESMTRHDNGTGELTFEQFVNFILTEGRGSSWLSNLSHFPLLVTSYLTRRDIATLIFNNIDIDGGGELDLDEIVMAFSKLGITQDGEKVRELMQKVDTNGDGQIGIDEFMQMLNIVQISVDRSGGSGKAVAFLV